MAKATLQSAGARRRRNSTQQGRKIEGVAGKVRTPKRRRNPGEQKPAAHNVRYALALHSDIDIKKRGIS